MAATRLLSSDIRFQITNVVPKWATLPLCPQSWRSKIFSWRWKFRTDSTVEQNRSAFIRHIFMHQGTVAVPLQMGWKPLMRIAPINSANLVTRNRPRVKAIKNFPKVRDNTGVHKVDKSIPQTCLSNKINWHVNKVILCMK